MRKRRTLELNAVTTGLNLVSSKNWKNIWFRGLLVLTVVKELIDVT